MWIAVIGLALGFVVLGADALDLGPQEARLGIAAGERPGPVGQVFGYWAPDLWPAQVWSSHLLAMVESGGRPTSAAVRWPSAIAGIIAGWILVNGMSRAFGLRAGVFLGLCWFGSLGLIDRSSSTGLNLIMGLGTLAAIERLITRGSDRVAGLWACLAFLAGGWPPLVVIGLAVIVIGRKTAYFSIPLVLPPILIATLLVVLGGFDRFCRRLGGRTHAPTDPEARLVIGLRDIDDGPTLESLRSSPLKSLGSPELESR